LEEALALFRSVGDKTGIVWTACSLGEDAVEEGVAVARQSDVQPWVTAFALHQSAWTVFYRGDVDRAKALFEESLACARRQGDANSIAPLLWAIGQVALAELDFAKTAALAEEAVSLAREAGICKSDEFKSLLLHAEALRFRGEFDRATALVEQSYRLSLEHGLIVLTPAALSAFGLLARDQGDYECAAARFRENIVWHRDKLGQWTDAINILELGTVANAQGQHHRAAKLFGAHTTMLDANERQRLSLAHNQRQFGTYIDATRALLGDAAYDAAFAEGCAMTTEQAFEYALVDESN
jgi:ATP/maltotriose-dependent transcriptional regulator MalT